MERPTGGAHGDVHAAPPSYRGAGKFSTHASPATFFAPFIAHGWRFIGEGARAATYGATTLVPPGCDATLLGENASFMVPGEHWTPETTDEGARLVFKACGFCLRRDSEAVDKPRAKRAKPPRVGLRDLVATHLRGMMTALVAMRVSATVYRHKRWSFECFREMYRNHRELKRRLRNAKVSQLGMDAVAKLKSLLNAFDEMFVRVCDPQGTIRAEVYDGIVVCPWDVDYEWQKNPFFQDDEMFMVPYAKQDDRDVTHSYEVKECAEGKATSSSATTTTTTTQSVGSNDSEGTNDAGIVGGKRKLSEESTSAATASHRCRLKPRLPEISCSSALEIAAELDRVAGAACHFFTNCPLCQEGPTFHEYMTVVTSAYDYSFGKEMQHYIEHDVIPEICDKHFPDDSKFYYTMLQQNYSSSCSRSLLKVIQSDQNPLLHISLMQKIEGALIMSKDGPDEKVDIRFKKLMREFSIRVANTHHKRSSLGSSADEDALSVRPRVIANWMDACQASCANLFSSAVPGFRAMRELRAASPEGWLEVGMKGTGYWTSVLSKHGIPAQAVNVQLDLKRYGPDDMRRPPMPLPPTSAPFVDIHNDIPAVCAEFTKFGLLINCAPRDGDLAIECLRSYTGNTIAVIGEWQGSTAGSRFVRRLSKRFQFEKTIALPQLSDSVHEVSIWKRRAERLSKKKRRDDNLAPVDVFPMVKKCRVPECQAKCQTLFCCRLCRNAFACAEHLHTLHDEWDAEHTEEHAARLLPKVERLRSYEIQLDVRSDARLMRSQSIMAFNPFRQGAQCWAVDYLSGWNNAYQDVRLSELRVDPVEGWR